MQKTLMRLLLVSLLVGTAGQVSYATPNVYWDEHCGGAQFSGSGFSCIDHSAVLMKYTGSCGSNGQVIGNCPSGDGPFNIVSAVGCGTTYWYYSINGSTPSAGDCFQINAPADCTDTIPPPCDD